MAFLIQTMWLILEFQDFKEDGIKSDMTIDDINFTLALFLIIKKTYLLYMRAIMQNCLSLGVLICIV